MTTTKILVADNDPMLLPTLALHLRNEDYDVVCAEDGETALAAARNEAPDVLVVNVGLSVGPRRTVHDFICDDPQLLAIPVIYLVPERGTGRGTPPKLPAQSMIRKPVPIRELLSKVAGALSGDLAGAETPDDEADEPDEQREAA
ncbi:MAG: response regulator [Planctomycetota bacterium]|jgi:two-component system KDP operon response regulator KdpE